MVEVSRGPHPTSLKKGVVEALAHPYVAVTGGHVGGSGRGGAGVAAQEGRVGRCGGGDAGGGGDLASSTQGPGEAERGAL